MSQAQPWGFEKTPAKARQEDVGDVCVFFSGPSWGQGTGFDLSEGFSLEPELVFKVALTYPPAHLAFSVWPGTW